MSQPMESLRSPSRAGQTTKWTRLGIGHQPTRRTGVRSPARRKRSTKARSAASVWKNGAAAVAAVEHVVAVAAREGACGPGAWRHRADGGGRPQEKKFDVALHALVRWRIGDATGRVN